MIELSNVSKSFGEQTLFNELNFRLNAGDKVGLVGRNGSGKSTLFKLILDEEHPDTGEVLKPKNYKIGALRQHLEFTEKTITDEVALALGEDDKYNIYKVDKILFGLGFSQEDLLKSPHSFSGGYQIRLNLAKLLLTEPNLLLLDEPTNYLDIVSLRWLKQFLKNFEGEVIIITHDRDFMDAVTTHTMGLVRRGLKVIRGNTHKFYEKLKDDDEHYEKQKASQEKKIKDLEEFIAKNKARAATATLAQSKVKQLEKMDILEDLNFDSELKFDFNYKETPAKVLLDVRDLSFGYTPDKILFKDISFTLQKGEVLGIIGKNGKGKSTLLNTIAGELKALRGTAELHSSVIFGHFGQTNISHLNPNNTIMDEIYLTNNKLGEGIVRSICGGMMFSGDTAKKKVSLLSGGEKSRVMLGKILAKEVNLLFLDEPTNHLDMSSIDALTDAIKNFDGSCVIVTHSEELLRAVCSRLIVFSNGSADYFDGTYDEFLDRVGWEDEEPEVKKKTKPKINKKEAKKQRALLVQEKSKIVAPIKKEVDALEKKIIEIEALVEKKNKELVDFTNQGNNSKVMEISKEIATLEKDAESKFELLEVSQTKLDDINNEYEEKMQELM